MLFIPVDQQTVDVDVWGSPLHGLYEFIYGDPVAEDVNLIPADRSGVITNVGAPPIRLSRFHTHWFSTANARIFDTGAEFVRETTLEDYDNDLANEWRSKAILNGTKFYSRLNSATTQWVYVAPDKTIWNIGFTFSFFPPDRIHGFAAIQRYGVFRFPNEIYNKFDEPIDEFPTMSYEIDVVGGITNPDHLPSGVVPQIMDVNNVGSKALVSLGFISTSIYNLFNHANLGAAANIRKSAANINDDNRIYATYLLELSGTPLDDGDPFGISLTVFRDQDEVAGTIVNDQDDVDGFRVWSAGYVTNGFSGFSRPDVAFQPAASGEPDVGLALVFTLLDNPPADELNFCGWEALFCDDQSAIVRLQSRGMATSQWWIFQGNPDQDLPGQVDWEASPEYEIDDLLQYNGFRFKALVEHVADPTTQPGVGIGWQNNWLVEFGDPVVDIGDIPAWGTGTVYDTFSAVFEGLADYYISKGLHTSWDGTPEQENFNQPGVGSAWENFWDGPFSISLVDFWIDDKVFAEGWVIRHEYTEPAFSAAATLDVNTARFECIRNHNSSPDNEPGSGPNWRTYWIKAVEPVGNADLWGPPIEYAKATLVKVEGDPTRYTAIFAHTSLEDTKPPSFNWEPVSSETSCAFSGLVNALNEVAYHVQHFASDQDIDIQIDDILAWAHFRDDDTIKVYEVDVRYERTKRDKDISFCWSTSNPIQPVPPSLDKANAMSPSDVEVFTGTLNRGPSTVDEKITWQFKTDGSQRHEIQMTAAATATGEDIWTENFSTYPLTWMPSSNRQLKVVVEGVTTVNLNENFGIGDVFPADAGFRQKSNWIQLTNIVTPPGRQQHNDFCSGKTFKDIDVPYFNSILLKFRSAISGKEEHAGPDLINLQGGVAPLEPISIITDQQFSFRPQRTQEQKDLGIPTPSIAVVIYSKKLVGPLLYGLKVHTGLADDQQYQNILEPNDFPWRQYGVFAPDAENAGLVTLTQRSPTIGLIPWLQIADYGDDVSCAYDPFDKTITRNSQYKVAYL